MASLEQVVADHYRVSDLTSNILKGLETLGVDLKSVTINDLSPVDEFHVGGREATDYAISQMSLSNSDYILDVGSGIGGAARVIATQIGCTIAGIDLTPEYVETAIALTQLTGLEDKTNFQVASALNMPFEDDTFDAAISMHVAMNIVDRPTLYKEIARVMKPGATLCLYDVMKKNEEPLDFPVPWANTAASSHLETPDDMAVLLNNAGFEVGLTDDRTEFANAYFDRRLAAVAGTPSPLGPHLIMGSSAKDKFKNIRRNINKGRVAPVLMTARLC